MKTPPSTAFLFGLLLFFLVPACSKVRIISQEQEAAETKLAALQVEDVELQQKITTLRQVLPPLINTTEAAEKLALKYQTDGQLVQEQLAGAVKSYEKTEAALKALKKEVADMH
jgi:cell division protein FtsB